MKQKDLCILSSESGTSFIEVSMLLGLVTLVGVTTIPNMHRIIDCNIFLAGLALYDPTIYHPDGSASADFIIPQSCSIVKLGFDPGPGGFWFRSKDPAGPDMGTYVIELMDGTIWKSGKNSKGPF
jgi:hypothetical protein